MQSTCPIDCKDPSGNPYPGNLCPIDRCGCSFVYKKVQVADIHNAIQNQQEHAICIDMSAGS
eukprot:13971223-Ditylum_brightwellii.AAC.1